LHVPDCLSTSSAVEEVILLIVRSNVSVISDSKQSNDDEILALAKDGHAKKVTVGTTSTRVHVGLATYLATRTQIGPWGCHAQK
jgi:hypothetical protein